MIGNTDEGQPSHPRRILITADAVGGVWQYTVDLVRCLLAEGIQVMVATMGPPPTDRQWTQLPSTVELVSSTYALEWSPEPWKQVDEAGEWLLSLRDRFLPDLVHLNGYVHADLPWGCPVLVVAHSCVASWCQAVHQSDCGPDWSQYRERVAAGLEAASQVVAPSRFMAEEIAREYGAAAGKIRVIHNFSSAPITPGEKRQPYCLGAGRIWDEAKNFCVLQAAAAAIPWPIHVAGQNDGRKLSPIKMLGPVEHEELLRRMSRASIFVHPALYEPFGLAVLEAARAGCCLVLSDIPSLRELWDRAAVFVDGRNPEAWTEVLQRLCSDPPHRQRWGRAAAKHAARYSGNHFRQGYMKVYRELMEQHVLQRGAAA